MTTPSPAPEHPKGTATPGPWTFEAECGNSLTIRAPSKSAHELGWEIATVYNEECDDVTPTMRADAKLIARAPAMRDALKEIMGTCETEGAQARLLHPRFMAIYDIARAAVKDDL